MRGLFSFYAFSRAIIVYSVTLVNASWYLRSNVEAIASDAENCDSWTRWSACLFNYNCYTVKIQKKKKG